MRLDMTWRKTGGKVANRRAWLAIVEYANKGSADALREAFSRSLETVVGVPFAKALDRQILGSLTQNSKPPKDQAWDCWANKYHGEFQGTLLCIVGQEYTPDVRQSVLDLVATEVPSMRIHVDVKASRETTKGRQAFQFVPRLEECPSIMSPIYEFMFDRLFEREYGVSEAIPVGICERENCFRFMLLEREGRKKFCSDTCRRLAYQQASGNWNEYMRAYRKKKRESSTGKETRMRTRNGAKRKKAEGAR